MGDTNSRLDRYEPYLNVIPRGTDLDTTTPAVMAETSAGLGYGNVAASASRALLRNWRVELNAGQDRIRSAFSAAWVFGDKIGTGVGKTRHIYVDLVCGGLLESPPLIVTAYFVPRRPAEPMGQVPLPCLQRRGA